MLTVEWISFIVVAVSLACIATAFTLLLVHYERSLTKSIEAGERDSELIDEIIVRKSARRGAKVARTIGKIAFVVVMALLLLLLAFSVASKISGGRPVLGRSFMVVASDSMSRKNAENEYLFDNDLGGQFGKYDIIVLRAVSSPDELKLYDIVAYRNDKGRNVIHRIVRIEGEGEEVRYRTRGDANNANDTYRPSFDDVIGVYTGSRARGIGAIVLFVQSLSGLTTVAAVVYCLILTDHVARKISSVQKARSDMLSDVMFGDGKRLKEIDYNGFVYLFDENGFTDKKESGTPEDLMIRITEEDPEPKKIIIEKRKNDGKDQ